MASSLDSAWDSLTVLKLFSEVSLAHPIDDLRAQKLTFLTELNGQKKGVRTGHMRFSKYKYGPYSWQLPDLLAFLEAGAFIEQGSRQLTKRGQYVLDYVLPALPEQAMRALAFTEQVARDYGELSGPQITKLVYAMRVPIHDKGGALLKIKGLPMGMDILNPQALPHLAEPVDHASAVLADLQREFNMQPAELDPQSESVRRHTSAAIARALGELTH